MRKIPNANNHIFKQPDLPWSNSGFCSGVAIPDQTVQITNTLSDDAHTDYKFGHGSALNPVNGAIVYSWSVRNSHQAKETEQYTVIRRSTDNGANWSAEITVLDFRPTWVTFSSIGFDAYGRLHMVYMKLAYATPTNTDELYSIYSDNDGDTWSDEVIIPVSIANGGADLEQHLPNFGIIENNGVLICPVWSVTSVGSTLNRALSVIRSTDNGANWTVIPVYRDDFSIFYNESTLLSIDNDNLLMGTRKSGAPGQYAFWSSDDNGLTWALEGETQFNDEQGSSLASPAMSKFCMNGEQVAVFYYFNRRGGKQMYKAIYAKVTDLLTSPHSQWENRSKITLIDGATYSFRSGYGRFEHYNDNFEGVGSVNFEINDIDVTLDNLTDNFVYALPTTHYDHVFNSLFGSGKQDPALLDNVVLWLNGEGSGGGAINPWLDSSGNGRNFDKQSGSTYGDGLCVHMAETSFDISPSVAETWVKNLHNGSSYDVAIKFRAVEPDQNKRMSIIGTSSSQATAGFHIFYSNETGTFNDQACVGHDVWASTGVVPVNNKTADNTIKTGKPTWIRVKADPDNATAADRSVIYIGDVQTKNNTDSGAPSSANANHDIRVGKTATPYMGNMEIYEIIIVSDFFTDTEWEDIQKR